MQQRSKEKRKKWCELVVVAAALYATRYLIKESCRVSALTGAAYVEEVLFVGVAADGSTSLQAPAAAFNEQLTAARIKPGVIGRAAVQFPVCCRAESFESIGARALPAQRRDNQQVFHIVLDASVSCAPQLIRLSNTSCPVEISSNPKFFPYFKDCVGAFDGTHIQVSVPTGSLTPFRNRKGVLSQNVLAVCSFDTCFQYVLSGWEGSAADATVLDDALSKDFSIIPGKYYLGVAGYGLSK